MGLSDPEELRRMYRYVKPPKRKRLTWKEWRAQRRQYRKNMANWRAEQRAAKEAKLAAREAEIDAQLTKIDKKMREAAPMEKRAIVSFDDVDSDQSALIREAVKRMRWKGYRVTVSSKMDSAYEQDKVYITLDIRW